MATSSSLKRPLDFDLISSSSNSNGPAVNCNKRRCFFTPQSKDRLQNNVGSGPGGGHNTGVFKESLAPVTEEVIKDELRRAHINHANYEQQPLLTLRQTQIICERLIKDREQKLRDEYDKILISKLAEQYDTFVKYTHDHIEKRYNDTNSHQTSYLS